LLSSVPLLGDSVAISNSIVKESADLILHIR
jgi:hypothetical protein